MRLRCRRRLGFAEFGPAAGRPLLWFHGTPGARRQIPPEARTLAHERGVRIVSVERPGVGDSTPHLYTALVQFAADVEELCDALGVERFAVAGLSGGGPYALACAHEIPERVVAAAILGGVAPAAGPEAAAGGAVGFSRALAPLFERARRPLGSLLRGLVRILEPFQEQAVDLFASRMPPGDQRLFEDAGIRRMFVEDLLLGSRHQMQAIWLDAVLFARPWGFRLEDIQIPVHLWYGDGDTIVPVDHGKHVAARIPGAKLRIRHDEGHLGGLGASKEIFDSVLRYFDDAKGVSQGVAHGSISSSRLPKGS